ncbi:hypothetical protein [Campylobacter concisus]|uniref:hypothetical protein n=1 Tax=Campylobacter concisus TaxID=199 RepID=UPI000CD84253|nr:hypothetical protein [Campylobacter concisus]
MNSFKENDKKMDFLDKNRDIQYSDKQTTYDKNKNAVKFTGDIFLGCLWLDGFLIKPHLLQKI